VSIARAGTGAGTSRPIPRCGRPVCSARRTWARTLRRCRWLQISVQSRHSARTVRTPTFGVRVRLRRLRRRQHGLHACGGEHGIERGGGLAVSVPDQKPEPVDAVVEIHQWVAGRLGHPLAGRMRGDAGQVYPPPLQFDDKQHVQPGHPTISTVKKSQASMPVAWARRTPSNPGRFAAVLGPADAGAGCAAPMSPTPARRACGTPPRCADSPSVGSPEPAAPLARPPHLPSRCGRAGWPDTFLCRSCERASGPR
jgi:hypothetical protein